MKKILLIVPCYNEESRLNFRALVEGDRLNENNSIELHYLFANDGSTDKTREILDSHCHDKRHMAFHGSVNQGKANVIYSAYQSWRKNPETNFDWIGFWDADLATPLEEIPRMMKYLEFYEGTKICSVWGSRVSRLGSIIKRDMHRHYLGRIFVTLVSNVLNVKAYDSQCGAKLFTPQAAEIAFREPFISRWIFDIEILLRIKEQNIVEYPLFHWEDVPGSKVKVFREMFRVGWDLLKIKKKYSNLP